MKKIIHTPDQSASGEQILKRTLIFLLLILLVFMILWLDRDGLKDTYDNQVSITDIIYFSAITITTVGYGDIVPVTTRARMIDVFLITPIRLVMWLLFLGTAYQFVLQKFLEDYKMNKLKKQLKNHTIICGFGSTGKAALNELLSETTHGSNFNSKNVKITKQDIIVIDMAEDSLKEASALGITCINGDATKEIFLNYCVIEKAKNVIITLGRDDSNILACLTVKHLNSSCRVIIAVEMKENIKLARGAGADVLVMPSVAGGCLIAAATRNRLSSRFLEDLLTSSGDVAISEMVISKKDAESTLADLTETGSLKGAPVLGIYRNSIFLPPTKETVLKDSDVIIYLLTNSKAS